MENKLDDAFLPINRTEALERIGGDPDFLKELLGIYEEEFLLRIKELRRVVNGKEFTAIRELGHSLKGSSANLSLPGLQQAALGLETAGQAQDIEQARSALTSLEKEFERLKKFLARTPA